jgi:hypothetical protein
MTKTRKKSPGQKFSADVTAWKRQDRRIARPHRVRAYRLPSIEQVRAQARSKPAKAFLSSKYYSAQMEETIKRFNQNPFSLFPLWKNAAREFLMLAQQMQTQPKLSKKQMKRFADAFFKEYQSNALVESIQGPKQTDSHTIPSISRGRFIVSRKFEASQCEPTLNILFKPALKELMANAHNATAFEETITRMLRGQSTVHANVRRVLFEERHKGQAYDATDAYYEQALPRMQWEAKLRELERQGKKSEADKLRANDLLSRQMETINDLHGVIGTVLGRFVINPLCDKFIEENRIKGIPKELWAPAKLALLGKKLHGE